MTRVEITKSFSHHGQTYIAGEVRFVSAAAAEYFCNAGWARAHGHDVGETPADVTLKVHNGRHIFSDTLAGVKNHG